MSDPNVTPIEFESPRFDIEQLASRVRGDVILPGDSRYEEARKMQAFTHNHFPAIIVRTASPEDVAECVKFGVNHQIPLAVRGGGHSIAGLSVVDGSLVIDMTEMRGVTVDPERQVARAEGGARSIDLALPANADGLALSTGDTGTVGFGGLVTGGGIGYFVRKYGLAADRLICAKVVAANGDIITASATENADLFWAIRGGGGNFGIVVEFEFQLVPVRHIYGGALILPLSKEVVRGYLDYSVTAPDELTTMATILHVPPVPFVPEERHGERALLILVAYAGNAAGGEEAVAPLRALAEPIADTVTTIPYPAMFQYMEWAEAAHGASIKMMFTDEVPDATIDDFIDAVDSATSPLAGVHLRGLGGQLARVPVEETAFAHRRRKYFVALLDVWFDPQDEGSSHREWTAALWSKVEHLRNGVYVNFLEDEGEGRVREAYPEVAYRRLAEVKAKYDPDNVFHNNQNVRPGAASRQAAA